MGATKVRQREEEPRAKTLGRPAVRDSHPSSVACEPGHVQRVVVPDRGQVSRLRSARRVEARAVAATILLEAMRAAGTTDADAAAALDMTEPQFVRIRTELAPFEIGHAMLLLEREPRLAPELRARLLVLFNARTRGS